MKLQFKRQAYQSHAVECVADCFAGQPKSSGTYDEMKQDEAFEVRETTTDTHEASIHSAVEYDLIGKIATDAQLKRRTIATILQGIASPTFKQYSNSVASRQFNTLNLTQVILEASG